MVGQAPPGVSIPPQILHVDDDEESLRQAQEYLQGEDVGGWGEPQVQSLQTFADALGALETRRFDLVILDVRLGGYDPPETGPEEEAGVRTLEEIRQRRFVPVIFWTNLPERARHLAGPLVRVHNKTDGPAVLLGAVRELFDTRLPAVNRALLRLVEDEARRYMWDFVATHWNELSEGADHVELAYLLARRLGGSLSGPGIAHLAEDLGGGAAPPAGSGKIHPAEIYFVPPIAGTKPGVGDVYRWISEGEGESWWLIVTPSCDLEWDKADAVVLATCRPAHQDRRIADWQQRESAETTKRVRPLLEHKTGGQDDRYLFLPAALTLPDLVVDFQYLRSVSRAELDAMQRMASLVSPFAEAVASRFTRYFGRVGTDDLDVELILQRLRPSLGADPDVPA
jgi:CheY-like chemotaxis protein